MSNDGLYERINRQCNADHIRNFLKPYKDTNKITKKEINVSGSKEGLILALRRGVAKNFFSVGSLIELLRECEENGEQHVFYFKPRTNAVRALCRSFDKVMDRLHGDEWVDDYPIFEFREDSYQWVDFRDGLPGKPRDWIAKAYGHERYFERVDVKWPTPDRRVETFTAQTINVVCLARWNDDDLLEIRIDSQKLESVRARTDRLAQVWKLLQNVFEEKDFVPWDLKNARCRLAKNRKGHADFELGDLRLIDPEGGSATFKTSTETESVDNLPARAEAVHTLAAVSDCDVVVIHWAIPPERTGGKLGKLSTICGGRFPHELVIRARTSSKAVDHVTNKLRGFNG